ncbi:glycosyltransferase family 2 protein [Streptomyces sp. SID3343]|uniref:glycosyltransferase n=1 Tax=Streptomyces sp. SID3343 TaxID=2690260 RepID=UPI001367E747|nr:glycosyltransferase [Streptomyces sp. SID3343]
MLDLSNTWVVIPVYNEEQVIAGVVEEASQVFPNIVCVDDGSRDGSAQQVFATAAHLIRHPVNLGQGAALQTGFSYALSQPGCEYIVTFDADGQHRVEDAQAMVAKAQDENLDVVLGSRFLEKTTDIPKMKRVVLRVAAAVSPTSRRLHLTDAHNGLRVFTAGAAAKLQITMNGMAHASEIVNYLARSGLRIAEAPVQVRYTDYSRAKGQSLINGVNILFDISVRQRGA